MVFDRTVRDKARFVGDIEKREFSRGGISMGEPPELYATLPIGVQALTMMDGFHCQFMWPHEDPAHFDSPWVTNAVSTGTAGTQAAGNQPSWMLMTTAATPEDATQIQFANKAAYSTILTDSNLDTVTLPQVGASYFGFLGDLGFHDNTVFFDTRFRIIRDPINETGSKDFSFFFGFATSETNVFTDVESCVGLYKGGISDDGENRIFLATKGDAGGTGVSAATLHPIGWNARAPEDVPMLNPEWPVVSRGGSISRRRAKVLGGLDWNQFTVICVPRNVDDGSGFTDGPVDWDCNVYVNHHHEFRVTIPAAQWPKNGDSVVPTWAIRSAGSNLQQVLVSTITAGRMYGDE